MGFLSNNVTPGHKQTAALFKVSNKEVQISPSLIRIIFYFLLQYNILQSLSLFSTLQQQQSKHETWEQCKHFPQQGITLLDAQLFCSS